MVQSHKTLSSLLPQSLITLALLTIILTTIMPTYALTAPPSKSIRSTPHAVGKLIYNAAKLYVINILVSHAITHSFGIIKTNDSYSLNVREPAYCLASYALAESIYYSYYPTISQAISPVIAFFNNHYRKYTSLSPLQKKRTLQNNHLQQKDHHPANKLSDYTDNQLIKHTDTQFVNHSNYTEEQIATHMAQHNAQTDQVETNVSLSETPKHHLYSDHNPLANYGE